MFIPTIYATSKGDSKLSQTTSKQRRGKVEGSRKNGILRDPPSN